MSVATGTCSFGGDLFTIDFDDGEECCKLGICCRATVRADEGVEDLVRSMEEDALVWGFIVCTDE